MVLLQITDQSCTYEFFQISLHHHSQVYLGYQPKTFESKIDVAVTLRRYSIERKSSHTFQDHPFLNLSCNS